MYAIIVGAGKLGYYLTRDLLEKDYEVTLMDWDCARVTALENELAGVVMYAAGSSVDGLEKAGAGRADLLMAVTGDDEDNLVIAQLGQFCFKIPHVIARVNDPRNEPVFGALGVTSTINGTRIVAAMIEEKVTGNG